MNEVRSWWRRVLVILAASGALVANVTEAAEVDIRLSPEGLPYYMSVSGAKWIQHPGAVLFAAVTKVETPVVRPSGQASDADGAYLESGLAHYSIVEVEVVDVLQGAAPETLRIFWKPHVRMRDGSVVQTTVGGAPGHGYGPLVPGMVLLAHVTKPMAEFVGLPVDRRSGLWDTHGPVFFQGHDESVYQGFRVDRSALELLGRDWTSADPSSCRGAVHLVGEERREEAIDTLFAQFTANTETWSRWKEHNDGGQ